MSPCPPRQDPDFSGAGTGLVARSRRLPRATPARFRRITSISSRYGRPIGHPVEPLEVVEVATSDLAERPARVAPEPEDRARRIAGRRSGGAEPLGGPHRARRRSRSPAPDRPVVQSRETVSGGRGVGRRGGAAAGTGRSAAPAGGARVSDGHGSPAARAAVGRMRARRRGPLPVVGCALGRLAHHLPRRVDRDHPGGAVRRPRGDRGGISGASRRYAAWMTSSSASGSTWRTLYGSMSGGTISLRRSHPLRRPRPDRARRPSGGPGSSPWPRRACWAGRPRDGTRSGTRRARPR